MLFNSLAFIAFLAIVLLVYYVVPKRGQWIVLLISSYIFYASFSLKFFIFIILTTLSTYLCALYFSHINNKQKLMLEGADPDQKKTIKRKNKRKKKTLFVLTLVFNFGILVVLKYLNFAISNINFVIGWFSSAKKLPLTSLILPLGISFYTFQSMGYLIDVYWGKTAPQKNFFRFALFVSFFPQIVEGPISRYSDLEPQLEAEHKFDYKTFIFGIQRITWGLFKKMVVADMLGIFVDTVFGNAAAANPIVTFLAVMFYFIQDYADFSGCMDIVIGVAQSMGIKLAENFERPYFARTIPEYWRRWHITLGTWFKDYIFYPISISKGSISLGKWAKKHMGEKGKLFPAIYGLIIVWLTTGLWHGASWNYVLWGLYYGLIIILGIVTKPVCTKIIEKCKINTNSWWFKAFQHIRTIFLLIVGRILFRANTLTDFGIVFANMFKVLGFNYSFGAIANQGLRPEYIISALLGAVVIFVVDLIKEKRGNDFSLREQIGRKKLPVRWLIWLSLVFAILIFGAYGSGLDVSQFIYMQF